MVLKSAGIRINDFHLPAFTVNSGEIVTCFLYGGAHFNQLQKELAAILTGRVADKSVEIFELLLFVEHVKRRSFKNLFYPTTVKGFLRKYGNANNNTPNKIYNVSGVHPETVLNSLKNEEFKLMSLYCTLSHTKNVVIDVFGIRAQGFEMIFQVLKENVDSGGSVIILDNFPDSEDVSDQFITLEKVSK